MNREEIAKYIDNEFMLFPEETEEFRVKMAIKIADWHIKELAKAKEDGIIEGSCMVNEIIRRDTAKARKETAEEILKLAIILENRIISKLKNTEDIDWELGGLIEKCNEIIKKAN